jgi:hypothetical protein
MIFLSEIVKPVHDACRAMKATLESDAVIKKTSVQTWFDKVDEAASKFLAYGCFDFLFLRVILFSGH